MIQLNSVINPRDNIEYFVNDKVVIYQGRFGHDNIIQIKSIWKDESNDCIYVSSNETLPGTYIQSIKYKISEKKINKIRKHQTESMRFRIIE